MSVQELVKEIKLVIETMYGAPGKPSSVVEINIKDGVQQIKRIIDEYCQTHADIEKESLIKRIKDLISETELVNPECVEEHTFIKKCLDEISDNYLER